MQLVEEDELYEALQTEMFNYYEPQSYARYCESSQSLTIVEENETNFEKRHVQDFEVCVIIIIKHT